MGGKMMWGCAGEEVGGYGVKTPREGPAGNHIKEVRLQAKGRQRRLALHQKLGRGKEEFSP